MPENLIKSFRHRKFKLSYIVPNSSGSIQSSERCAAKSFHHSEKHHRRKAHSPQYNTRSYCPPVVPASESGFWSFLPV
jgi:hypothetical protein